MVVADTVKSMAFISQTTLPPVLVPTIFEGTHNTMAVLMKSIIVKCIGEAPASFDRNACMVFSYGPFSCADKHYRSYDSEI